MNGISADSKQGFDTDVSSFTGTGESPTLPGKSGGKNRGRKAKKIKERPRISVISTNSTGSVVKIQDGATRIASASGTIPNLVPVQVGNGPDPPVLSIPDTAADNETISRLLGGQGAALLELGSSDCVNIDFIQENADFSDGTGIEAMQTQISSTSTNDPGDSGARTETHPEPSGSVPVAAGEGMNGSDLALSPSVSLTTPHPSNKMVSSALDLSMKNHKLSNISVSEVLSNLSHEIRTAKSKKGAQTQSQTASSGLPCSNSESVADPANLKPVPVGIAKCGESSSTEQQVGAEAEFTDPTGDSLLLNIAQVNNAISGGGGESEHSSHDGDTGDSTATSRPTNPLMYIITSRDKTTGMTQRFRVTVDPESVMYIPVMNIGDEASTGSSTATNEDVSFDFISCDGTKENGEESGPSRVAVDNAIRDAILGDGNVTAIGGKEDLGAITGDMITSALMLQGQGRRDDEDPAKDGKIDEGPETDKSAEQSWTKKTPLRKKEAQEVIVCDYPGCGVTIVGKSKFRIHKLGHNDNRPHKCPHEDCDWSFPSPYKLRRHLSGHSGAKPFVCGMENCGKQFSTIYNLKMHLNSHFRQTAEICDYKGCGKVFNSAPLLKIHKRKHFEEQRLKCEYPGCTKTFTTSSALGSHQRVHVKDATDYPCPFEGCTKVYDKACRLKLHMRSHTGERPFKCTFEGCDWAFTCIQKLTRHIVRHTGERKYRCKFEGCNKLFTRLEHLKSHEVFHSGQKPFACKEEGCNARFAARSSLYMHQKRHQQVKPMREKLLFSCPLDGCDMSFASKLGLKSHIVKGHGVPLPFTGGAGDFELIGLGNDQLHANTVPSHTAAVSASSESTGSALPTIALPTIPNALMTSSLLQSALIPSSSSSIPLSTLTSSRDEAASILASGLLTNQFYLPKNSTSINLTTTATTTTTTKDSDAPDAIQLATTAPTSHSSLLSAFSVLTASSGGFPIPTTANILPNLSSSSMVLPSSLLVSSSSSVTSCPVSVTPATMTVTSAATPKVYLENKSGSARTDYRAVTAKNPLPPDAVERFKKSDEIDAESLSQSDSSQSSDGSVQATFIPLNMMTSASLTLRDPATGTRYIQTQLLQDDPPDMPDMGFPLSSHDSADQSVLDAALSVSAMLTETGEDHNSDTDFMTSDGVISGDMVSGFRESTINLQDLE